MLLPRQLQSHKARDRLISDHLEPPCFISSFASFASCSAAALGDAKILTCMTLDTAAEAQKALPCAKRETEARRARSHPTRPVAELGTVSSCPGHSPRPQDSPSLLAALSLPNPACPTAPSLIPNPSKLRQPLELQMGIMSGGGFVGLTRKGLAMAAW